MRTFFTIFSLTILLTFHHKLHAQGTPSVSINGPCLMVQKINNTYSDPGFSAKDSAGNSVNNLVMLSGTINTSVAGRYELHYCLPSSVGPAPCARRVVLVSTSGFYSGAGSIFDSIVLPVYTTTDTLRKIVTDLQTKFGLILNQPPSFALDTANVGTYFIVLYASDSICGATSITIKVVIRDLVPPLIKLNGKDTMCLEVTEGFIDPWVMATDNYWDAATITIIRKGFVDVNVAGYYYLTYVATDPLGNRDSILRVVKVGDCLTAVRELNSAILFKAYPNPASNVLFIETTLVSESIHAIHICDYQGRLCLTQKFADNAAMPLQLNVGDLPPGIYFIEVISSSGTRTQKSLLER